MRNSGLQGLKKRCLNLEDDINWLYTEELEYPRKESVSVKEVFARFSNRLSVAEMAIEQILKKAEK